MTLALHGKSRRRQTTLVALAIVALLAAIAGGLLASGTFDVRAAIFESDDTQGANDFPGQKDLTWLSIDDAGLPTSLLVKWNWDIVSQTGNNTSDGCALFDSDNDLLADFSICQIWGGATPTPVATRLYTCGDDRIDRCSQPIVEVTTFTSSCSIAVTATDPFPTGDSFPNDTTATCTVNLADVGFPTGRLLNVCSYPSQQPNSNPEDCVLDEPFVVGLDITTAVSAAEVIEGDPISDTATMTGSVASPSGTVDFYLCGPDVAGACETGGTLVADDIATTGATAVTTASTGNLSTAGFAAGEYCFRAEYTPSAAAISIGYAADSHFDAATECFTVVAPPTPNLSKTAGTYDVDTDTATFTVTITNNETNAVARNVTVTDTGATLDSTTGNGSCTPTPDADGSFSCTVPAGGTLNLHVSKVQGQACTAGSVTNVASAVLTGTATALDGSPTSQVSVTVPADESLCGLPQISKAAGSFDTNTDLASFTITLNNNVTDAIARSVTITDTGATLESVSPTAAACGTVPDTDGTFVCSIAAGEVLTLSVTKPGTQQCAAGTVSNVASAVLTGTETALAGSPTASVDVTIPADTSLCDGTIWNVKVVTNVDGDTTVFSADVTGDGNFPGRTFSETNADSFQAPAGDYTSTENEPLPNGYVPIITLAFNELQHDEGTGEPICPALVQVLDVSFLAISDSGTLAGSGELIFCHYNEAVGTVQVQKTDAVPGDQTWNFEIHRTGPNGLNTIDVSAQILNTGASEPQTVAFGEYEATETEAGFASFDECPEDPGPDDYVTLHTPPTDFTIDEPGENIIFAFSNLPCPETEATGQLLIEKWHDLDGDGERDAGEPPIEDWDFTVTGPEFPGGATFSTDAAGQIFLPVQEGGYAITEEQQSGWFQSGLIVDGSPVNPVSITTAVLVAAEELTIIEFGNSQLGSIEVTKIVNDQFGTATRAGWTFILTGGCKGVAQLETTGVSGVVVFDNLEPTTSCGVSYLVTEQGANTNGFVVIPGAVQSAHVTSGQQASLTFTNSRGIPTTPTPPPDPTATPTNTPVPPTNTPVPTETVAGEITPGPGGEATPIPPDSGTGTAGTSGASIFMVLIGLAAITAGSGALALARKRR